MTRTWIAAAAMGLVSVGIAFGQEYPSGPSHDGSKTSQSQRYSSEGDDRFDDDDQFDDDRFDADDAFSDASRQSQRRQQEDQQSYREQQSRAFDRSQSDYDRQSETAGRDVESSDGPYSTRSQTRSQSHSDQSDSIGEWLSDWWTEDQASGGVEASNARQFISQHDGDEDGYLSWSELPRDLRSNFNRLDRDGDGYLSQSELSQHANQMARTRVPVEVTYIWVVGADRGKLELNELQQAYRLLQRIDNDNDGYITRAELRNQEQQVVSQFINHCFDCHDKNYDDEITRSEASGSMLARGFDHLDRNSDDKLTRGELRTAMRSRTENLQASPGRSTQFGQSELEQSGDRAFRDEEDSRR